MRCSNACNASASRRSSTPGGSPLIQRLTAAAWFRNQRAEAVAALRGSYRLLSECRDSGGRCFLRG